MDEGAPTAFSSASRPMKYALSFAVFYCTFALGIFMTVLSPAAKDFEYKLESDTDEIGSIFSIQTGANLVGAFACGVIFIYVNRQYVVVLLLAMSSACLFIFPYVKSVPIFFTLGGIMGFGAGGYDTAQVAWILDIWRHEAGPFILGQHFAFSVGALMAPVLFAPFLTGDTEDSATDAPSVFSSTENYNSTTERAASADLYIPFTICGCLAVIAVIVQITFIFIFRRMSQSNFPASNNNNGANEIDKKAEQLSQGGNDGNRKSPLRQKIIIVFLGCCYAGFYQSMQQCTMQFLPQFAINSEVNLSEAKAATILLGLNIGFAVGRAAGIPTVLRVSPHYILLFNFVCVLIGNTVLFAVGGASTTWMWVGSIFLGVGFSTMYPAFFAYLEKYLFVNDSIAAVLTVSGGGMAAVYPLIVKTYVKEYPKILNYMVYLSFGVTLVAFMVLFRYNRRK